MRWADSPWLHTSWDFSISKKGERKAHFSVPIRLGKITLKFWAQGSMHCPRPAMLNFVPANESMELELLMFPKLCVEMVKKGKVLASSAQASPPLCVCTLALTLGGAVLGVLPWVRKAVQTVRLPWRGGWLATGQSDSVFPPSSPSFPTSFFPPFSLLFLSPHLSPVALFFRYYSLRGRLDGFWKLVVVSGLPWIRL